MNFNWSRNRNKQAVLDAYNRLCNSISDINEHLPVLFKYASNVSHITECGVSECTSSYAFALALKGKPLSKLIQIDIFRHPAVTVFQRDCRNENINTIFYQQSDLVCPIEPTELLFIDTLHNYGQLKRELYRWNPYVSKYIIMHDTVIDGETGDCYRTNRDIEH